MKPDNPYDKWYAGEDFYCGKTPSPICDKVIEAVQPTPDFRPRLLDLGCGEGRNAVYFAKNGFDVVGIDVSKPGVAKVRRYAAETGVDVKAILADISTYEIDEQYDVVFSVATLQYLPPEIRGARFEQFKQATRPGGINAHSGFVKKPFIPKSPDGEPTGNSYKSGELFGFYWDWEILYCTEDIFDCNSAGVPHKHACNRIIARRPIQEGSAAS